MSDQPLTLAVFEEFQRRLLDNLDTRFASIDARFDGVDARSTESTPGSMVLTPDSTRSRALLASEPRYGSRAEVESLMARIDALKTQIETLEKRIDRA